MQYGKEAVFGISSNVFVWVSSCVLILWDIVAIMDTGYGILDIGQR